MKWFKAILLICLAVSGCQEKTDSSSASEVWSWNTAAMSLRMLIPDFASAHSETKVNLVMSAADMQPRLLLSLVARAGAPDVVQLLQQIDVSHFAQGGCLQDLTGRGHRRADDVSEFGFVGTAKAGRI